MNDYIDYRGYATDAALASKNNDGIFDFTIGLRWKIEPVKDTHVRNISSLETIEKILEPPVHDTVIIHRHDSIIVRERVVERVEETASQDQYYYVYFENNVSDLDDKGLVTVQQVADRLNEDEDLYAVVTGFCDNTGSSQLNYILGDKRAANVIEELRYEYGVPNNHLYAMGMGKVVGRGKQAAAYGPNRRAQIRLVDKATFERMKQNLDEKKEMRVIDTQTIPLSESARKAQINTYKSRKHDKVTVEKGTTLSKLAKQYYDNMYCWVYLYMANIDRIENPNALTEGSVLEIPELTKEELAITKEESLVLYGMSHQFK
jgi:outer membrane protein OmpA-like peptidoglycan-associated protein